MFADSNISFGGNAGGWGESPSTPATQQRRRGGEPILPVTCHQLCQTMPNEEKISIGTRDFTNVMIVGNVMSVDKSNGASQIDYTIADDDEIENNETVFVRHFQDNTPSGQSPVEFMEGSTVRVSGRLRHFGNEKSLIAFRISEVTDQNELAIHTLEVKYAQLFYEKDILTRIGNGFYVGLEGTPLAPPTSAANPAAGGTVRLPTANQNGHPNPAEPMGGGGDTIKTAGLTGVNLQVMQFIKSRSNDSEEGVSLSNIKSSLASIPSARLDQTMEFLCSEGHIYSTIDEEHYKHIEC